MVYLFSDVIHSSVSYSTLNKGVHILVVGCCITATIDGHGTYLGDSWLGGVCDVGPCSRNVMRAVC